MNNIDLMHVCNMLNPFGSVRKHDISLQKYMYNIFIFQNTLLQQLVGVREETSTSLVICCCSVFWEWMMIRPLY